MSRTIPRLFTVAQVAAKLGRSPGRVRQLIQDHRIEAIQLGRDYLISAETLSAYTPLPVGHPPNGKKAAKTRN